MSSNHILPPDLGKAGNQGEFKQGSSEVGQVYLRWQLSGSYAMVMAFCFQRQRKRLGQGPGRPPPQLGVGFPLQLVWHPDALFVCGETVEPYMLLLPAASNMLAEVQGSNNHIVGACQGRHMLQLPAASTCWQSCKAAAAHAGRESGKQDRKCIQRGRRQSLTASLVRCQDPRQPTWRVMTHNNGEL
jgi:hypothetical protein